MNHRLGAILMTLASLTACGGTASKVVEPKPQSNSIEREQLKDCAEAIRTAKEGPTEQRWKTMVGGCGKASPLRTSQIRVNPSHYCSLIAKSPRNVCSKVMALPNSGVYLGIARHGHAGQALVALVGTKNTRSG